MSPISSNIIQGPWSSGNITLGRWTDSPDIDTVEVLNHLTIRPINYIELISKSLEDLELEDASLILCRQIIVRFLVTLGNNHQFSAYIADLIVNTYHAIISSSDSDSAEDSELHFDYDLTFYDQAVNEIIWVEDTCKFILADLNSHLGDSNLYLAGARKILLTVKQDLPNIKANLKAIYP